MLIEQQVSDLRAWAPAKVNPYLEVVRKREDGYHDLETIMVAVNLYDTLRFTEDSSAKLTLNCTDPDMPTGEENLVLRAAALLRQHTQCRRGVRIHLTKRIPSAAGLGGGSSDAAATLAGLNRLWQLELTPQELAMLGADLGSDVPFFFAAPAAWCTGRGEIVTPLVMKQPLWLVLVKPPMGLATAEVYRNLSLPQQPRDGNPIRQALETGDIDTIGRLLHNRLQPVAEKLCSSLTSQRKQLERLSPAGAILSGSGTTLFALCRNYQEASSFGRALRSNTELDAGTLIFVVRSCRQQAV